MQILTEIFAMTNACLPLVLVVSGQSTVVYVTNVLQTLITTANG